MKRFRYLLAGCALGVYGVWVYTGPLETLETRYGSSGMMWGMMVFGLMIPYGVYIILNIFQSRGKKKTREGEPKD